jgi:hypothetical protein
VIPQPPTIEGRVHLTQHFPGTSVSEIKNAIEGRSRYAGTRVIPLDSGRAFVVLWDGLPWTPPYTGEMSAEQNMRSEDGKKLARFLYEFYEGNFASNETRFNIGVGVPSLKYGMDLWLPPVRNQASVMYFRGREDARLSKGQLIYEFTCRKRPAGDLWEVLRVVFEEWFRDVTEQPVGDELLGLNGYKVRLENDCVAVDFDGLYVPVTFPWLELYLRLFRCVPKSELPKEMRYVVSDYWWLRDADSETTPQDP